MSMLTAWQRGWTDENLRPHGPEADPYSEYYKGETHNYIGGEWVSK